MSDDRNELSAEVRSVADIEGPWIDQSFESSLIERCRKDWTTPACRLSNEMLATFIRQKLGLSIVIPEARRRIENGIDDDSEFYPGELLEALRQIK